MGILDYIFPVSCLVCGRKGQYLCNLCLLKVKPAKLFCLECHKPSIKGVTHAKCKKISSIDFAYSPWSYEGVIKKAILKLKYNFAFKIAEELADKCVEKIKKNAMVLPHEAVLIPIPLHKSRKNWRGFNQSEEIGKRLTQKLNWKYDANLLVRIKNTANQTETKGKNRYINIKGAFSLNPKPFLDEKNYILFDDVLTTGSTLKEACKVLKHKGAKRVWGLTIAA